MVKGSFVGDRKEDFVVDVNLFFLLFQWVQRSDFAIDEHRGTFDCSFFEAFVEFVFGIEDLELVDRFQGKSVSEMETLIPVFKLRSGKIFQVKGHGLFGVPCVLMLNFFEPFIKMVGLEKEQELIIVIEFIFSEEIFELILKLF